MAAVSLQRPRNQQSFVLKGWNKFLSCQDTKCMPQASYHCHEELPTLNNLNLLKLISRLWFQRTLSFKKRSCHGRRALGPGSE